MKLVAQLAADGLTVQTELKNTDLDLVELPAWHSKRYLYRSFLLDHSGEVTFDNLSYKFTEIELDGSTHDKAISRTAFCMFWQKNFPKLCISCPSEDICNGCVIFANRHKYLAATPSPAAAVAMIVILNEDEHPLQSSQRLSMRMLFTLLTRT
jgi:hypothetical protein